MDRILFRPIYFIQGFLEAGKTSFFRKIIDKSGFTEGTRFLLLLCEDGLEEYEGDCFDSENITIRTIDSKEELNKANLMRLADECNADRIAVEYNGMWHLAEFVSEMPDDWTMFQIVTVIDGTTIKNYNKNFGSLVVDKLNVCDIVMINRFEGNVTTEELHKLIRAVNRRTGIYYMYDDGRVEEDTIRDPLPFDLSADEFEVKDKDYPVFYNDIMSESEKYEGKKITFSAMITKPKDAGDHKYLVGRFIMTCCVADMKFSSFIAEYSPDYVPIAIQENISTNLSDKISHYCVKLP